MKMIGFAACLTLFICFCLDLFASPEQVPVNRAEEMSQQHAGTAENDAQLRYMVEDRWWESGSAVIGVTLKKRTYFPQIPIDSVKLAEKLAQFRDQGFAAIEIFAPSEGGYSYSGLDQTDYYRIDPEIGTMDDFRRVIRQAHRLGLAVITFENLGYCSVDAQLWQQACADVKAGKDTRDTRRFLWSDVPDAPAPSKGSIQMYPGEFWGKWYYNEKA